MIKTITIFLYWQTNQQTNEHTNERTIYEFTNFQFFSLSPLLVIYVMAYGVRWLVPNVMFVFESEVCICHHTILFNMNIFTAFVFCFFRFIQR